MCRQERQVRKKSERESGRRKEREVGRQEREKGENKLHCNNKIERCSRGRQAAKQ